LDYYVRSLLTAGLANAMQISKFAIKRTIFIFKVAHTQEQPIRRGKILGENWGKTGGKLGDGL